VLVCAVHFFRRVCGCVFVARERLVTEPGRSVLASNNADRSGDPAYKEISRHAFWINGPAEGRPDVNKPLDYTACPCEARRYSSSNTLISVLSAFRTSPTALTSMRILS